MIRDAEIQKIAAAVLSDRLASSRFLRCDVRSEVDFDGESIVRVIAHVEKDLSDARATLDAMMAIRARLETEGDERYVFLNIKGEDEDEGADDPDDDGGDRATRQ